MSWRLARSIATLRDEVNHRWPTRDHRSDGTIGDARHAANGSGSDHNPWIVDDDDGKGVVRALDVDVDGINAAAFAEHIRQLGLRGDVRLRDHGYVIFNGRIASAVGGWRWRIYTGASPHTDHVHVSVSRADAGYDSTASWGIDAVARPAKPKPAAKKPAKKPTAKPVVTRPAKPHPGWRDLRKGDRGDDVAFVQRFIGKARAGDDDGIYGTSTERGVDWYRNLRNDVPAGDGVDIDVWRAMGVIR